MYLIGSSFVICSDEEMIKGQEKILLQGFLFLFLFGNKIQVVRNPTVKIGTVFKYINRFVIHFQVTVSI